MASGKTNFAIDFQAVLNYAQGTIIPGDLLCRAADGETYVKATAANLTAAGGIYSGLARTTGAGNTPGTTVIQIQYCGEVPASVTGLGTGTVSYVGITSGGRLERIATSSGAIGRCNTFGMVKLYELASAGGVVLGVTGDTPIEVDNTDPLNPIISLGKFISYVTFAAAAATVGIVQDDQTANGVDGTELLLKAQNATGTGAIGAAAKLQSGEGTAGDGNVELNANTANIAMYADALDVHANYWQFSSDIATPRIFQSQNPTNGATGYNFELTAQSASGTVSTGGDLISSGGSGVLQGGNFVGKGGAGTTYGRASLESNTASVVVQPTSILFKIASTTIASFLSSGILDVLSHKITGVSNGTNPSDAVNFSQLTAASGGITALTGDVTATGPGSVAATLATVNSNVGSFGSASSVGTFTVNGKGLITAAASVAIALAASAITSGTLAVARGGTNSGTTLNNNRVMISSSSAIVEATAITAARALISDANGIPTHSVTTSAELVFVSGVTSSIQTQLNTKTSGSGTTNTIPKFTGASSLGDSRITDNGTTIGIGTSAGAVAIGNSGEDVSVNAASFSLSATSVTLDATSIGFGAGAGGITISSPPAPVAILSDSAVFAGDTTQAAYGLELQVGNLGGRVGDLSLTGADDGQFKILAQKVVLWAPGDGVEVSGAGSIPAMVVTAGGTIRPYADITFSADSNSQHTISVADTNGDPGQPLNIFGQTSASDTGGAVYVDAGQGDAGDHGSVFIGTASARTQSVAIGYSTASMSIYSNLSAGGANNFTWGTSTGTFTTSTGTNTFRGNTVIEGSKTFTTGTGAVSVLGAATFTGAGDTFTITQPVATSGTPHAMIVTGGAHTAETASTEVIDVNINLARTVQHATGALTTQRAMVVQAPTYSFVGASTITNAATLAVTAAPTAGTNATITSAHAFWVQAGRTKLDGGLSVTGSLPTSADTVLITQPAAASGVPYALQLTAGAHTAQTAGAEAIDVYINLQRTLQHATGAISLQRSFLVSAPTLSFVGASTVTSAATFAITGAPSAGTNATLTNSYALWVGGGRSQFDGDVRFAAGALASGSSAFDLSGSTGTFLTSTGNNTLGGNVTISGSKTFTTGTGAVAINGAMNFAVGTGISCSAGSTSFDFSNATGTFTTSTGTNTHSGVTVFSKSQKWTYQGTAASMSASATANTIIGVTSTSAVRTITLPTASGNAGLFFIVKNESGLAVNLILVATTGNETIDGVNATTTPYAFAAGAGGYQSEWFYSNGTSWFTMAGNI